MKNKKIQLSLKITAELQKTINTAHFNYINQTGHVITAANFVRLLIENAAKEFHANSCYCDCHKDRTIKTSPEVMNAWADKFTKVI